MAIGNETERFEVIEVNGNYGVVDLLNGKRVAFGYNNPPLYGATEWGNYFSARGFCQKLFKKNSK